VTSPAGGCTWTNVGSDLAALDLLTHQGSTAFANPRATTLRTRRAAKRPWRAWFCAGGATPGRGRPAAPSPSSRPASAAGKEQVSVLLPLCRSTQPYSRHLVGERAALKRPKALAKRTKVSAGGVEPPASSVSANGGEALCGSPFPRSPPTVDGEVFAERMLIDSVDSQVSRLVSQSAASQIRIDHNQDRAAHPPSRAFDQVRLALRLGQRCPPRRSGHGGRSGCAALFPRGRLGRSCRPSAAPAYHSR
jgi:hypothetical protein